MTFYFILFLSVIEINLLFACLLTSNLKSVLAMTASAYTLKTIFTFGPISKEVKRKFGQFIFFFFILDRVENSTDGFVEISFSMIFATFDNFGFRFFLHCHRVESWQWKKLSNIWPSRRRKIDPTLKEMWTWTKKMISQNYYTYFRSKIKLLAIALISLIIVIIKHTSSKQY